MSLINLGDGYYALKFPYHMVTDRTVGMAFPSTFKREIARNKLTIRFVPEAEGEAGTKRADSAMAEKSFPAEVALLRACVTEEDLKDYIIVKVNE